MSNWAYHESTAKRIATKLSEAEKAERKLLHKQSRVYRKQSRVYNELIAFATDILAEFSHIQKLRTTLEQDDADLIMLAESYLSFLQEAKEFCLEQNKIIKNTGDIAPDKKAMFKSISRFLAGRRTGPFKWPDVEMISSGISHFRDFHALDEGVFSSFGYHVGGKGVFYSKRREILDHIFKTDITGQKHLPTSYLSGWGSPETEYRLKKMAFTLASFCRLHNSTKPEAVSDWKYDLDYLKKKYYDPKAWTWWPDPITYAKGMP